MGFRERRQFVIAGAIAIALAGFGYWAVRSVLPAATCTDTRKNQGETAVDCGGPCIPCSVKYPKAIEAFWARAVPSGEGRYDAAAEVRNPNAEVAAISFGYEFKLFDAAGIPVVTQRGTSFLYPGESSHIVEIGLATGRTVERATIEFFDAAWAATDAVSPDITAGNRQYVVEDSEGVLRSKVKAVITNRSLQDLREIFVGVVVFDDERNLVGVHRTRLDELLAGQARPVELVWPSAFAAPVSSFTVEPRSSWPLGR